MADLLTNAPLHILPTSSLKRLVQLDSNDIWIRFRRRGTILFRGFSPTLDEFKSFTAQFCRYFIAYPGNKRRRVENETDIQTVDLQNVGIPLHSELSYSPVRPDLAWFFCVGASKRGGATILCDGIALAEALPTTVRGWLENKRLQFKAEIAPWAWQTMFGCDTIAQAVKVIRQRSYVDMVAFGDKIRIDHVTVPLAPTKYDKRIAFCNNLILHHWMPTNVRFADGSILPDAVYEQLDRVSAGLTIEIVWRPGDVLMIDNTRMMHGRRPVLDDDRVVLTRFGS
jgi:alpha-ketoglutarate-dependent taurine dioxygenase